MDAEDCENRWNTHHGTLICIREKGHEGDHGDWCEWCSTYAGDPRGWMEWSDDTPDVF
jgi:hypothetical protein